MSQLPSQAEPAESRSLPRGTVWWKKLSLALVTSTACIVAIELVVRTLPLSDQLGWTRVPPVDERVEAAPPRADGEIRLLGLGDSFASFRDADGVNFMRVMESAGRDHGLPLTLVNLGEAGSGVARYRDVLEQHVDQVEPDLVIVGLYLGNDLLDYEIDLHRSEPPSPRQPRTSTLKDLVRRNLVSVNLLYRRAKVLFPSFRSGSFRNTLSHIAELYDLDPAELEERLQSVSKHWINLAEADAINPWDLAFGVARPRLYSEMHQLSADSRFPEALGEFLTGVDTIADACKAREIPIVFVGIPVCVEVSTRYHDFFEQLGYDLDESLLGESALTAAIASHLADRGVPFFDLTPEMRAQSEALYLDSDTHWNKRGQEIAGLALLRFLEKSGLFGGEPS